MAESVEVLEDEGDDLQAGEALVSEEEEDPEEPSWDSALDYSLDSTHGVN